MPCSLRGSNDSNLLVNDRKELTEKAIALHPRARTVNGHDTLLRVFSLSGWHNWAGVNVLIYHVVQIDTRLKELQPEEAENVIHI
jgi:hypothetical protein